MLTERRSENFESNCETQIAISTKNVAAEDRTYRSSIVVQNQLNFLGMRNQRKDLVLRRHLTPKSAEESIEQRVCASGSLKFDEGQSTQRNIVMEKQEECGVPLTTLMARKDLRAVPILDFEKDVRKCAETYASQFRRMCRLKELNTKPCDTSHQDLEITEDQDKKLLERVAEMDTQFEYKMSSSAEAPFQRNDDHIADETAGNAGEGSSTCTSNRLSKDEDQLAISEVFNLEGLQQTFSLVERLNKIANTAKVLQSELEDYPVCEGTPTARVQLTQVQVNDRKDARDWLLDTAIEKAIKKLPGESDGGRVRHLVQVFESIK